MGQIVFAGGECDAIEIVSGSPAEIVSSFDGTYARCAILCGDHTASYRERCVNSASAATPVSSNKTVFAHAKRYHGGTASFQSAILTLYDSSGHPWVSLQPYLSTTIGIFANTGSGASPTWTLIGSGGKVFAANTPYVDDIRVFIDPTGLAHQVEWAVDQTQVSIGTFANAGFTEVAYAQKSGCNSSSVFWSEPIITEGLSTIGAHVFTSDLGAAGNYSQWTGTNPNAVNEIILDDTTSLQTSTVGNKSTGTTKDFTIPAGYVLPSIFVWSRIKQSGASPQNASVLIRSGSTDYATAMATPGVAFSNVPLRMDTNPATSATWTDTAWNAAERGIRADT